MRLIWAGLAMSLGLAGCDESNLTNEPELEEADSGDDLRKKGDPLALNGDGDYCNGAILCVAGEGDCDYDYQCTGGTGCAVDNGAQFGFSAGTDVCVIPSCEDKIINNGETGVDCGSADCGVCVAVDCSTMPANGATNHCSVDCPCPAGESDCDSDAECVVGTYCATDVGPEYGYPVGYDVCEGLTCTNAVQDGDETGVDCGGSCVSCVPAVLTAFSIGQSGFDRVGGIAMDTDGSYVITGQFENTLTIGGVALTAVGGFDIYLAKFDANDKLMWAKSYGSPINDGDLDLRVSIDSVSHKVAVGGQFAQTVNFGGTVLTATNTDGFLVVLDKNGVQLAARKYGDVGVDRIADVQYDAKGNLLLAAVFTTKISLGGTTFTTKGLTDVAVGKLTGGLVHSWSQAWGSTIANDSISDLSVDASSNMLVAGTFGGTMAVGATSLVSKGSTDAFIAKLTSLGAVTFTAGYGGTGNDAGVGVVVDPSSRPTLVGYFKRTVNFGAGNVVAQGVTDKTDVFAVALDPVGVFRWAHTFGGIDNDQPLNAAADPVTGDVTMVGYVRGTALNFYPGGGSVTSAGGNDAFIKKLSAATGTALRASKYGGALDDHAKGIRIFAGDGYVVGDFQSTVNFGTKTLTSLGLKDAFVLQVVLN